VNAGTRMGRRAKGLAREALLRFRNSRRPAIAILLYHRVATPRADPWGILLNQFKSLVVGLLVGVVIALFQALTQIQEMTLVFVPKILAIFVTILITLPFMGQLLEAFMGRVTEMILTSG